MKANFSRFELYPVWGFQTNDRLAVALDQNEPDYEKRKSVIMGQSAVNIIRVITYVPVLNILSGAIRIINVIKQNNLTKKLKKNYIVRAVLDIAFGPFLIFADVISTLSDLRTAEKYIEAFKLENAGREPRIAFCSNHSITAEPNSTDGKPFYYYTLYPEVIIENPTDEQKSKAKYIINSSKKHPITAEEFFSSGLLIDGILYLSEEEE